jgi:hypothetical protein
MPLIWILISTLTSILANPIEVILYYMDDSKRTLINSQFSKAELEAQLFSTPITVMVSETDLQENFGGAYSQTGLLHAIYNPETKRFDVKLAYNSAVYTADCGELKE